MIKIQNIEFKTCHITEINHEGEPLYLIQHDRSGIGAAFDHDEAVLQAVIDALKDGNLYISRGNLKLQWPNKSIRLDKFLYQIYSDTILNPADIIKSTKDDIHLCGNILDYRRSSMGVLGRDKIPHTESRDVDNETIGNRQYVKVWMKNKNYNRTFYCDALPGLYDLLVDTRLCYLVSNYGKIQASINSGKYQPHMGQVAIAAFQGLLTDNNLDQARAILNQLTDNQRLDVDHLIEDRCNCTLANLSLTDRANQAKYNFFGRFYDPWRIYGAYDRKTGQYLIELDLIKEFSTNTPVVVRPWFFKCKNIETLINLLENLQARNNTILSKSKLDELRIKYSGGLLAFPTPWERYQQVRTDYGQKMPKVKRDTVDDILHQQRLIDMDRGKFRSWTILQPKPSIEDLGNFFSAIYNSPVYLTRCEQIASAETQH